MIMAQRLIAIHCNWQELAGIAKLDDANNAGGRNSDKCTLILTEGDSAKTLAISGLSVVGRDNYGVFPLRGKLLNVRDASATQVCSVPQICAALDKRACCVQGHVALLP